jgi:hypothetical protein
VSGWPGVSLLVSCLNANGAASQAEAPQARFDMEPGQVEAMMGALGWGSVGEGEAPFAVEALGFLLDELLGQAGALSGQEFYGVAFEFELRAQFERTDPGWEAKLEGRAPWRLDGSIPSVLLSAKGRQGKMASGKDLSAAGAAFAATMAEQVARLGSRCAIAWSDKMAVDGQSALPRKWEGAGQGAAYCVELGDGSAACAGLGPSAAKAMASTPLGRAFGMWRLFGLQASMRPLKLALGGGRAARSYASSALSGEGRLGVFPCQVVAARGDGGEQERARVAQALRVVFGPQAEISLGIDAAEGPLALSRAPGIQAWLDGFGGRTMAARVARSLARAVGADAKRARRPKASRRL